jgi:hypothetical protein
MNTRDVVSALLAADPDGTAPVVIDGYEAAFGAVEAVEPVVPAWCTGISSMSPTSRPRISSG